jgi:hypothetical protein
MSEYTVIVYNRDRDTRFVYMPGTFLTRERAQHWINEHQKEAKRYEIRKVLSVADSM